MVVITDTIITTKKTAITTTVITEVTSITKVIGVIAVTLGTAKETDNGLNTATTAVGTNFETNDVGIVRVRVLAPENGTTTAAASSATNPLKSRIGRNTM